MSLIHEACEKVKTHTRSLRAIHLEIEKSVGKKNVENEELVYRLRKVFLHYDTVLAFPVDLLYLHVMSPELRTILEQMLEIGKKKIQKGNLMEIGLMLSDIIKHACAVSKSLSPFIHPTPDTLSLSRCRGGFDDGEDELSYSLLYSALSISASCYCICLMRLSELHDRQHIAPLISHLFAIRKIDLFIYLAIEGIEARP